MTGYDVHLLLVSILGLGALVAVGEGLRRWGISTVATRRLVHGGVCLFVVVSPWLFDGPGPIYLLAGGFVLANGTAWILDWWPGIHAARPDSWGTVALPLALIPALGATWTVAPDRIVFLQIAFLIHGLADPLASWMGQKAGRRPLVGKATAEGSAMFFGVAVVVASAVLLEGAGWTVERALATAVVVSVVATGIEAICRHGWDNFFVVIGVILVLVPIHGTPGALVTISRALVLGLGFGAAAYAGRTLNKEGAVGGGLFAASLLGLGGWAWATPGFVFFVLSSTLSLVDGAVSAGDGESEGRTLRQVLANGGISWGLLGVFAVAPSDAAVLRAVCYAGFLGALAAAAADTWATEIGVRSAEHPWSLRTFSRVEAGVSGAVSGMGTVGGALGAASVAGAAFLTGEAFGVTHWIPGLKIVGSGMMGMAVDSVVGATLQVRYRDPDTGRLVEEAPASPAAPSLGWTAIDNETVNLAGTTAGAVAAILLV